MSGDEGGEDNEEASRRGAENMKSILDKYEARETRW